MDPPTEARRLLTVADYLELEQSSPHRHEFRGGRIVGMAGGTGDHSLVIANVVGASWGRLRKSPCKVYESNLRVLSTSVGDYAHPDVTVVCGPRQYGTEPAERHTVVNPKLIVEVLSPSTEADDRGAKFDGYRALPSFEQYVLVAQDRPHVQTFLRQAGGGWLMLPYVGLDAVVPLPAIGIELPMADVYGDVTFGGGPPAA